MRIVFDIVYDNIAGLEWRQLLLESGYKPQILSKSWKRFTHRDQIFAELDKMAKAMGTELEVIDGKYTAPKPEREEVHHIATPRTPGERKDIEG